MFAGLYVCNSDNSRPWPGDSRRRCRPPHSPLPDPAVYPTQQPHTSPLARPSCPSLLPRTDKVFKCGSRRSIHKGCDASFISPPEPARHHMCLADLTYPARPSSLLPPTSCASHPPSHPASCRRPPATCHQPPASCLLPPTSCLQPPASCLLSPVSRLPPSASCFLLPVSCLTASHPYLVTHPHDHTPNPHDHTPTRSTTHTITHPHDHPPALALALPLSLSLSLSLSPSLSPSLSLSLSVEAHGGNAQLRI